jgi:hypothetical protein
LPTAESEQEQEVAEALFNLASGGNGSGYPSDVQAPRVKAEEPAQMYRASYQGSSRGRGRGHDRRKQGLPRAYEDARQWAENDSGAGRNGIATPKAVKALNTSSPAVPSVPLAGLPSAANLGIGMGLGAFAGTFPNGLNGAYFGPNAANTAAAVQAAAAAQAHGTMWPPSFPGRPSSQRPKAPDMCLLFVHHALRALPVDVCPCYVLRTEVEPDRLPVSCPARTLCEALATAFTPRGMLGRSG